MSSHRDCPQRTPLAKCSPRAARTQAKIMQPVTDRPNGGARIPGPLHAPVTSRRGLATSRTVQELAQVQLAGTDPIWALCWRRSQCHRLGLQHLVSMARHHGFESLAEARRCWPSISPGTSSTWCPSRCGFGSKRAGHRRPDRRVPVLEVGQRRHRIASSPHRRDRPARAPTWGPPAKPYDAAQA